jgi:DNA replication protein DnaC
MSESYGDTQLPFAGNVPAENLNSTLDNYTVTTEHQAYAKALAEAFVDTAQVPAGLLLAGTAGSGKSHLAVGIARRVAERGGSAAFLSFDDDSPNFESIADPPNPWGWWSSIPELVDRFDVIVIDDMPGDMMAGVRNALRELVLASYNAGKKLVITSNQPTANVVQQIAETPESGSSRTDKAIAVSERMAQFWQTVEFEGESYRATQPKWWEGVQRPITMPRTLDEVAVQIRDSRQFPRLLASLLLRIAEALGTEGSEIDELTALLARERNR